MLIILDSKSPKSFLPVMSETHFSSSPFIKRFWCFINPKSYLRKRHWGKEDIPNWEYFYTEARQVTCLVSQNNSYFWCKRAISVAYLIVVIWFNLSESTSLSTFTGTASFVPTFDLISFRHHLKKSLPFSATTQKISHKNMLPSFMTELTQYYSHYIQFVMVLTSFTKKRWSHEEQFRHKYIIPAIHLQNNLNEAYPIPSFSCSTIQIVLPFAIQRPSSFITKISASFYSFLRCNNIGLKLSNIYSLPPRNLSVLYFASYHKHPNLQHLHCNLKEY